MPLVRGSDLSLLVLHSDLPAVSGARGWARALREQLAGMGAAHQLGVSDLAHEGIAGRLPRRGGPASWRWC